ncbi:MAG: hypothetical protein GY827_06565 [Cytophagales bacterium]|nr:hypothetical protein [Cytophagales bacterium]
MRKVIVYLGILLICIACTNSSNTIDIVKERKRKQFVQVEKQLNLGFIQDVIKYKNHFIVLAQKDTNHRDYIRLHASRIIALSESCLEIDSSFSEKIQHPWKKIAVYNDTLFGFFNDRVMYWANDSIWKVCENPYPVMSDNIFYEDDRYVFFQNHSGSNFAQALLFVYNKQTKEIRGLLRNEVSSIIKDNNTFWLVDNTGCFGRYTSLFGIDITSQMSLIPPNDFLEVRKYMYRWDVKFSRIEERYPYVYYQPQLKRLIQEKKVVDTLAHEELLHLQILSMFQYKKQNYFFADYMEDYKKPLLLTVPIDSTYEIIDTLNFRFAPNRSRKFGETTIIEKYDKGFIIIQNDSIININ